MIVDRYSRAPFYAQLYPVLAIKALEYGYTLALHGSMQRDLDVIAIPWEETVREPLELVKALEIVSGGFCSVRSIEKNKILMPYEPTIKPHGRLCWIIALSNQGSKGPYIDLSVVPIQRNS